jgi:hypothetical protein
MLDRPRVRFHRIISVVRGVLSQSRVTDVAIASAVRVGENEADAEKRQVGHFQNNNR